MDCASAVTKSRFFHRGTHEIPEIPEAIEHIHADPHFRETLAAADQGE
jgi:hypothetical protein